MTRSSDPRQEGGSPELPARELEQFSSAIVHDLRGPLRAIATIVASLNERWAELSPDLADGLQEIGRHEIAIESMVNDLLDLVRAAGGPLDLAMIDMEALVREAWAEVRGGGDVELNVGKLPQGRGNRSMLKLVWKTLLANALRYTAQQSWPRIDVGGSENADDVVYGVRDNGGGFDMGFSGMLFYVYERVYERHPGTGVGLAIVQRIVTRHRGNVWVEVRPDHGAYFQFSLPLRDPE